MEEGSFLAIMKILIVGFNLVHDVTDRYLAVNRHVWRSLVILPSLDRSLVTDYSLILIKCLSTMHGKKT